MLKTNWSLTIKNLNGFLFSLKKVDSTIGWKVLRIGAFQETDSGEIPSQFGFLRTTQNRSVSDPLKNSKL
jgi:hypothetical protein